VGPALPACLEAGREAVEEELDAELEALVVLSALAVPLLPRKAQAGGSGLGAEGFGELLG
jgi:hypothetical protein